MMTRLGMEIVGGLVLISETEVAVPSHITSNLTRRFKTFRIFGRPGCGDQGLL